MSEAFLDCEGSLLDLHTLDEQHYWVQSETIQSILKKIGMKENEKIADTIGNPAFKTDSDILSLEKEIVDIDKKIEYIIGNPAFKTDSDILSLEKKIVDIDKKIEDTIVNPTFKIDSDIFKKIIDIEKKIDGIIGNYAFKIDRDISKKIGNIEKKIANTIVNNVFKTDSDILSLEKEKIVIKILQHVGIRDEKIISQYMSDVLCDSSVWDGYNSWNGVLVDGVFSISPNRKVYFSKGNLQYNANNDMWRFAEHQYDIIGMDNGKISKDYDGWIDLFGWGTSGWNSGAKAFHPYSISKDNKDYFPGGSCEKNLKDDYVNADWGIYNKISNGGKRIGAWRTLTASEMYYLLYLRKDAGRKGIVCVNGVMGLALLPDNWDCPFSYFKYMCGGYVCPDKPRQHPIEAIHKNWNYYTLSDWRRMEESGVVFLPAAGYRSENGIYDVGIQGAYWSSTVHEPKSKYLPNCNPQKAWMMKFPSSEIFLSPTSRHKGCSVRLVQDVYTKETELNNTCI